VRGLKDLDRAGDEIVDQFRALRRALSPEFGAAALAVFIPWRGGRRIRPVLGMAPALMSVCDRRRRRQFSLCGIRLSCGVVAAGTRPQRARCLFSRSPYRSSHGRARGDAIGAAVPSYKSAAKRRPIVKHDLNM
jgi:hypothetical protein